MKVKIAIAILVVLSVFGGLAGIKKMQIGKLVDMGKANQPPPESVSTAVAREERWQDTIEAVGSIVAVQGVTVTPEVAGTVNELDFESGAVVAKGDLLLRLDTSSEAAQLRAIEAQVSLAKINADRARHLRSDNTVSQSELDSAEAAWQQYQASADAIRAAIEKKTIHAPFAGRLGIRQVNLGEYLDTGKPIVSLQSLTPVYAEFSLPQQSLAQLKTGTPVRLTTDTYTNHPFEGTLTAINPDLDTATRSVRVQATLDNSDQLLRPGMFARIAVLLPSQQDVLIIPATSVLSAPFGDSVFVVTNTATGLMVGQRFIRTGRAQGDFVSVTSGLTAGERVASAGIFKLRNNMAIVENNELTPKASESPRPPER